MATRIDWDELFPPPPVRAPRGQTTRIDLGNVGDINQSNAVNRTAKGDMPADIVAEMLAGQSDEEQALRELSPIDALARSLEIPPRMENYQRGQNSLRTAEDILSMIPGPGNVIAARDAFQGAEDAGKAFGAGDTRGGLLNAALAALSGVGAVVGLPTSRAAREAAREGSRTANVLIPAPASKARDRALDMRDAGKTNPEVFAETKRFFGPEGQPMMEVPDRRISIDTSPFQPGDRATFGDLIDHPSLFGVRPELAGVPIDFTDKFVTQEGVRGGIARRSPNQAAEITLGERPEWYREQIPKLLQYKIAEDAGLSSALRHDLADMIPEYQRAVSGAREIIDNPRPGDDLEAAINYLAKVEPWRDRLQTAFTTGEGNRVAPKEATRLTAGNANARVVRSRALAPDDVMRTWGPYPYARNMPSFEKVIALPQENLTREQIAQFLADWQNFGAGAGR